MRKVLVISRYYGTRIPGLMKYLPEYGWQPTLLTTLSPEDLPVPPGYDVVTTPRKDPLDIFKKAFEANSSADLRGKIKESMGDRSEKSLLDVAITMGSEWVYYPDAFKGWKKFGIRAGKELLNTGDYHAIISSSAPVTSHIIARELRKRYRLPWLADLRDPWSQNHNYPYSPLRLMRDRRLEIKTLAWADALVTVSSYWADNLSRLHGDRPVATISNGYDPEKARKARKPTEKFTITYTGNIYPGWQKPGILFQALREMLDGEDIDPADLEVHFYGHESPWLTAEVEKYGLAGVVQCHGPVPAEVSLKKQKESQVLYLMDWDDPKERGVTPLKVFEYMASARPILATGGITGNAVDDYLAATGTGVHALDAVAAKDALAEMYREFKGSGAVAYHGKKNQIKLHSQKIKVKAFSDILDKLAADSNG